VARAGAQLRCGGRGAGGGIEFDVRILITRLQVATKQNSDNRDPAEGNIFTRLERCQVQTFLLGISLTFFVQLRGKLMGEPGKGMEGQKNEAHKWPLVRSNAPRQVRRILNKTRTYLKIA
jgi:hypothetical protein